jgi:outer membrane protein assembly factor BamB
VQLRRRALFGLMVFILTCTPLARPASNGGAASAPGPLPAGDAAAASAPPAVATAPGSDTALPALSEPPRTWTVVWRRELPFVTQPPRPGNGLVYTFVGNDVIALDAGTGEVRWRYTAPAPSETGLTLGCPCATTTADFTGKDVYVLAGANELRALEARTGQLRWARRLGQAITTPTVSAAEVVVLGTVEAAGFALYGLDERTGAIRWQLAVDRRLIPWVALDGSTVLGATSDQRLLAVDAPSGRLLWTTSLPPGPALPPPDRVGRGALAIGAERSVWLIDTATGGERWRVETKDWPGAPLQAAARVFAATASGQLVALDEHTGQRQWSVDTGHPLYSSALAFGEGLLYAPSRGREVVAVEAASGQVRWTRPIGELLAAPAVDRGAVLAGTVDGDLVVLAAASGEEWARLPVGESVRFSPVVSGLGEPSVSPGLVYVVADRRGGSLLIALQPEAR